MPYKNLEDRKANAQRYYQANRERKDAQSLQWRLDNPDKHKQSCAKWRSTNKERTRETSLVYYEQNRDQIRESGRLYYQANKDAAFTRAATRRARKRDAFVEAVSPQNVFDRDKGICQICDEPIGDSTWHVDHVIPLARGGEHSYANVQLSHAVCNLQKGVRL